MIPAEAAQMATVLKGVGLTMMLSDESLSDYLLRLAVNESKRKSTVQLAEEFARTTKETPAGAEPALIRLFRMGEVALRLYLTLVMMTAKADDQTAVRPLHRETAASHFAEMFGYDDMGDGQFPPGPGTRRVERALKKLDAEGFIKLTRDPGHHPKIAVVHPQQHHPPYITLPIQLWSNSWITALSAPGLAVYVALRLVTVGKKQGEGRHVPPYEQARFGFSPDSWQRGTKNLTEQGLLEVRPGIVETRGLRSRHRNVYHLNFDRVLESKPSDPIRPIAEGRWP